jgi:uncharacterized protein YidB (DUF937 family)
MGLLDSLLGGENPQQSSNAPGGAALVSVLSGLLASNGGLQGLLNKFTQAGHGDTVASWVSTGENQPISPEALQRVIGPDQVNAIATKLGVDPAQASALVAKFLPTAVDKLTPNGAIDPSADHSQTLSNLLPSLLQSFGGGALGKFFENAPRAIGSKL